MYLTLRDIIKDVYYTLRYNKGCILHLILNVKKKCLVGLFCVFVNSICVHRESDIYIFTPGNKRENLIKKLFQTFRTQL